MGRAARNNPVAEAAKKGELTPKKKPPSKRECDRQMGALVKGLLMRELIRPGSLKKELEKMTPKEEEDA